MAALLLAVQPSATLAQIAGSQQSQTHLSEDRRTQINKVVVIGGTDPADREITGTYEEVTPGLYGGINQGAALGSPSVELGPVNVSFPIPILTLPGAIAGGVSGKYKRELQEFRDALAEELAGAANQPLSNDRLALGAYRDLERVHALEPALFAAETRLPEDADATLYVSIDNLSIDVDKDDAILTTTASLSLKQKNDATTTYSRLFAYQDRAALKDWTRNDNALFRDYANFALHYLGREIAAETFDRVRLAHTLTPQKSDTLKLERRDAWRGRTRSLSPTLAWALEITGADSYGPWADSIDAANTYFDVEIYDTRRIVYAAKNVTGSSHSLNMPLEACKTYRWSVRPAYHVGERIRFGDWMREPQSGNPGAGLEMSGSNAAAAPAYIEDFATLTIDCKAR